ncbi:hypothetical protein ALC57_09023 [Trachymyrmex cornetzi]|uniref:Double jelly roll-like domain-containing protein n=1 Tax=Trachymyrmex cornetzi TaxID=471704 RepID=A0A151J612_9HYME|nr:hypothetical protein ALC57_09023 [Trachymyrmex cornetzi]
MSLTFTLTGKSCILATCYFLAIDLSDGDYEVGLTDFETYHTISNVNSSNNNEKALRNEDEQCPLTIRANNNTMKKGSLMCQTLNFYTHWPLLYEISEMVDILNIGGKPIFDDCIVKFEFDTYNPYVNTTFGHSEEISIPIQQQDLYTLPCESILYVESRLTLKEKDQQKRPTIRSKCVAFMFYETRYELSGAEIDRNRNDRITSTLKSYASFSSDNTMIMQNAGLIPFEYNAKSLMTPEGYFIFGVSLSMLFDFCDYKRVIIKARHELILIRARYDNNCIVGDPVTEPTIELFKIQWRIPHVMLNDVSKLSMLRTLESGRYLCMTIYMWIPFSFYYPLLQNTTKHSWAIKTATQLKKNIMKATKTYFDHRKLTNVKIYLNSEFYPYNDLNLNFDEYKTAVSYDMYVRFRTSYYQISWENRKTLLNMKNFLRGYTHVIIDCSRQNKSIKSGTVDVRLEFEFKENVPANNTAYCLIIHDCVIEYSPMSNVIYARLRKLSFLKEKNSPPLFNTRDKNQDFLRSRTVSKSRSP